MVEMTTEMLAEGVVAGKPRAIARAITLAECGGPEAAELVARLRPHSRRGHLIGLTGSPGAGKSSLIGKLAREYRTRDRTVGVIAVDPSSPFTGGAVLGDRIRMQEIASDPGVFVRSMASRGRSGGLAAAVDDAAVILKAAGKDIVLVETVGVGQGELEVANAVQTVVVVLTPGMGDEIQSLKAGLLEVADIYVVNKADLPGADAVARSLSMVTLHGGSSWERPVVRTSVVSEEGIAGLADAIEAHRDFLCSRNEAPCESDVERGRKAVLDLASRRLMDELESTLGPGRLRSLAGKVAAGEMEPGEAADEALKLYFASRFTPGRQPDRMEALV